MRMLRRAAAQEPAHEVWLILGAKWPISLRATQLGPVAAQALHDGARGRVCAVFSRSFYISLDDGCVCVGPADLGPGPLNLVCDSWLPTRAGYEVPQVGDSMLVRDRVVHIGKVVTILTDGAKPWLPKATATWNTQTLAEGLTALENGLPQALPLDGLARLVMPGNVHASGTSPIVAAALAPTHYLGQLIERSVRGDAWHIDVSRVLPLIGLGPGLTPSGDDYLCGIMIALTHTKGASLRNRLWQALEPHVSERTGDISRAHLAAAAEGFGSAALHDLLAAIVEGSSEAVPEALRAVTAIGHTSGWDALAGVASALRATFAAL